MVLEETTARTSSSGTTPTNQKHNSGSITTAITTRSNQCTPENSSMRPAMGRAMAQMSTSGTTLNTMPRSGLSVLLTRL